MTNEQTALLLDGQLELIMAIKGEANKIPWVLDGKEVEGVEDLNHVIKNVENKISAQIDDLLGGS